jgi:hypothetical protein
MNEKVGCWTPEALMATWKDVFQQTADNAIQILMKRAITTSVETVQTTTPPELTQDAVVASTTLKHDVE